MPTIKQRLYLLDPNNVSFPPVNQALTKPDGLLALGGNLEPSTLIRAYKHGVFPWYNENEIIQWWSPNPRLVIYPDEIIINRSLRKFLKKNTYIITQNLAFRDVILSCAQTKRPGQNGTWLTEDMKLAYIRLFDLGYANSVEVWHENTLVGGLYGLIFGKVFFGESMYSHKTNASKTALVWLCEKLKKENFALIDCQSHTEHLENMGARFIPRDLFVSILNDNC